MLEIIVAIAIIAMISAGIAVAVVIQKEKADIRITTVNASAIRMGIKSWWIDHDTSSCPDVRALVADGVIDRGKVDRDAWGQPWRIQCEALDATIVSMGPDRRPDTEDDIRVPPS